ncbi:MAG: hypothetical protein JST86_13560 [Bacteroidetes bacterium]|nr:hypothetical protein [Bacteroidota bacterium]
MKKVTLLLSVFIASCMYIKAEDVCPQQYTAKYKLPTGCSIGDVSVFMENGTLHLNCLLGSTTLEITGDDKFYMPANSGTIVFLRNDAKRITGIRMDIQNLSVEGIKEERDADVTAPVIKPTFPIRNLPAGMIQGDEGSPN